MIKIRIFFLTSPEEKEKNILQVQEILPLPDTGEDVLLDNMVVDNLKFHNNERVKVKFDNGRFYYGRITKINNDDNDNILYQVHFDDGEIVENLKENELSQVKERKKVVNEDLTFTTRVNYKNRGDNLHRLEKEGFTLYYLSVQENF